MKEKKKDAVAPTMSLEAFRDAVAVVGVASLKEIMRHVTEGKLARKEITRRALVKARQYRKGGAR